MVGGSCKQAQLKSCGVVDLVEVVEEEEEEVVEVEEREMSF